MENMQDRDWGGLLPLSRQRQRTARLLEESTGLSARYGLTLTGAQIAALVEVQGEALADSGRLEFGEGIYPRLIQAFCDSPYLTQEAYSDTLAHLCRLFYHIKTEALEQISDEELIHLMVSAYNGPCQGSLALLEDAVLEAADTARRGGPREEEPREEEEAVEEN